MNLAVSIALFSLAMQLSMAAALALMSRAPGWERVRALVYVALSAALYSAVDVWATAAPRSVAELGWVLRANVVHAAIHVSGWLWYTFSDETGKWRLLPPRIRRLAIANVMLAAAGSVSGIIVSTAEPFRMVIPSLGVDYTQPQFSPIGNLISVWFLFALGVSVSEHLKRARQGVPGSKGLVVGFILFILLAGEEALVAAGVINFLFLADLGFLCVVVPVGIQLGRRFIADARRLREMGQRLASEVEERTTERDAAREALMEQERLAALGRLAAGVGHEINNPLQYLFLSLDELREASAGRPRAERESLDHAVDAADRIRRVVEGLRVYSRRDADAFVAVRVSEVVDHALRVAAPQLRTRAQIVSHFGDAPPVLGDEARLVQVVVNPLVNAAQSLMVGEVADPTIYITTRTTAAGDAEIEIRDNGPGFAEEILPQLGEPYVTTKSSMGGTGLGLFVSRGIVEAHGGTLVLDNAAEGGARVRITLPRQRRISASQPVIAEVPVAVPEQKPAVPTPVSPRHILVVDDEAAVRTVLARGLTGRGYRVTVASDGLDALRRLAEQEVDVIVSDLMMPRMAGIELAAALETSHPELRRRFIVMTGGAISPAAEAFVRRDDVTLCEKPVGLAKLCEVIEAIPVRTATP